MNPDKFLETLQQNFRVGLGAATALVEALPDAEKRDRFVSSLQSGQIEQNMQQWAEKGELTEQEARRFVEETLAQVTGQKPGTSDETDAPSAPVQIQIDDDDDDSSDAPSADGDKTDAAYQAEIKELTAQIEVLKAELAAARAGNTEN